MQGEISKLEEEEKWLKTERDSKLHKIGNICHPNCIPSKNEDENEIVHTWGKYEEVKIDGSLGWMHHH